MSSSYTSGYSHTCVLAYKYVAPLLQSSSQSLNIKPSLYPSYTIFLTYNKMASKLIESHRAGAEVHHGDSECRKKSIELLGELGLPRNLFPMEDIQEFGYNKSSGFMWLIQKKPTTYTFKKIKRKVSYATEVTAFVEPRSIKKLNGMKTKELLIWLSISEMYFADPTTKEMTFKSPTGISDSCEADVFDLEE